MYNEYYFCFSAFRALLAIIQKYNDGSNVRMYNANLLLVWDIINSGDSSNNAFTTFCATYSGVYPPAVVASITTKFKNEVFFY